MQFYLDIPVSFPGNVEKTFDLIVPEGTKEPPKLLLWIHGGGWQGGEKRIYNDFERFSCRDYAVLSIDYRLSQEAPFPAQLLDCKAAVRWARAHEKQYGYDASRILVGGSSSGGHLAAMLGVTNGDPRFENQLWSGFSSEVCAVVDSFGPVDLQAFLTCEQTLSDAVRDLLAGGCPAEEASPAFYLHSGLPPFLVMHGDRDPLVPVEQSREFARRLQKAGCDVTYLEQPGGEHGFDSLEAYNTLTEFILKNL